MLYYAIWPISIMVFGQFSLWYLANIINAKLRYYFHISK